ncbi:MAG: gamma carbonic anhydrase family protein, partial [Alkalispirochaeta sp.]
MKEQSAHQHDTWHSFGIVGPYTDVTPRIGTNVFIAPGAVVLGDITLADDVSIWYNSVLRGDINSITIGRRSNVQDGCVLHVGYG